MMARSAVFLDEMGVGVQWKLRNPPVAGEPVAQDVQAEEPMPVMAEAPPARSVEPAPVADAPPSPVPAREPEPRPAMAAMPSPAPAAMPSHAPDAVPSAAPAAAPNEPAAASDDDSTAWFDEAPAPARAEPVGDEAIAAMDWAELKAAVATCTRCNLCETRRNAVNGRGAANATWMAIAAAPTRLDEKENQSVAGEAGQLLDNMLKAIALKPEQDVYVTHLVKCRPSDADGADRAPTGEELLACRPFLDRELALTGATMAMTFGQYAAKGLMMGPAARGKVMRYGAAELPVVATYHPDDLLRRPEDKAKAWGDLCLAKAARD
ncbi:uracil-DNA glycosylase [Duganella sp. BJB488]|uniref:uracil-DNA glycosylase n=1 Tax=unclassified Duganella TaxID=2636909 RepID=UPI000E352064|nr:MULTISPECIES: uracil-DNA glycosylase [unclassified Duganella]RFP15313.1 uracil-DNA glycosylase [Duganella sp. BJB489]RFP19869.1 uracil-DNA glycosylase [Duganella sp. BJB488]RFP38257.1 uracil-DNA glycosylase [Duganella sp. BJB480]